jgi:hypothetical protein
MVRVGPSVQSPSAGLSAYKGGMKDVRLSPPALLLLVGIACAGAFALGRSMPSGSVDSSSGAAAAPAQAQAEPPEQTQEPLPPGHPPTSGAEMMGPHGGGDMAAAGDAPLDWKVPPKWQLLPSTSKMRLATYRVPRAPGDTQDAELSVVQAGGSVDANAQRWVGQFDEESQKTAKRSTRKVGALDLTIVEVEGTYSGMGESTSPGWGLLGAIVAMPSLPCFFKLTGPAKTVAAARADFDAMMASLKPKGGDSDNPHKAASAGDSFGGRR